VGGAWSFRNISGGLFNLLQAPTPVENTDWDVTPAGTSLTRLTDAIYSQAGIAANAGATCAEDAVPDIHAYPCLGGGVVWPTSKIGGIAYEVRWTAPFATTIWVSGDVWAMRTLFAHQQTLDVVVKGLDAGLWNIPMTSRGTDPYSFATAYGAGFLQGISVAAGDTLNFIVSPNDLNIMSPNRVDIIGMDLTISTDAPPDVPEPSTLGFMVSGLAATAILLHRKKA
jgi:hypothetical protein